MRGPREYSMRGYGSNIDLLAGVHKEVPEKSSPEKKKRVTKKASPEKKQISEKSSDDGGSEAFFSELIMKTTGKQATKEDIEKKRQTLLQINVAQALQDAAAKAAAAAEATKSTTDKPPQRKIQPAPQPPPQQPPPQQPEQKQPSPAKEEVPPKQASLEEGGDEYSGHFSAPLTSFKMTGVTIRVSHCSSLQEV